MVSDDYKNPESTSDTNQRHARDGGGIRGFWNQLKQHAISAWFSFVGVILLVAVGGNLIGEITLRMDCTEITDGVVTQMIRIEDEDDDEDSGPTWAPVFRYGVDGRIYEQQSSTSSYPPKYKVGQAVTIRYDPADPKRYVADGDHTALVLYGALTVLFLGFTAALPVAMITSKRQQSDEA